MKNPKHLPKIPDFPLGLNLILGWPNHNGQFLEMGNLLSAKNAVWYLPENGKHPRDIFEHLEYIYDKAQISQLPVIIFSFSPVVADFFRKEPERIYVLRENKLVPITQFLDQEWLAQFSLGNLYQMGDFDEPSLDTPDPET